MILKKRKKIDYIQGIIGFIISILTIGLVSYTIYTIGDINKKFNNNIINKVKDKYRVKQINEEEYKKNINQYETVINNTFLQGKIDNNEDLFSK